MKFTGPKKGKLSERIRSYADSPTPLRDLAGNLSRVARYAIAEANSLSLEKINVTLKRLPKKLDGFRLIHLSDIHHSPFTSLEHITRCVKICNRLKPDMFVLTGDYVSHEPEYIAPASEILGELRAEFGTYACLGNHDHWTDAEMVTDALRDAGITVLINEGVRAKLRGDASVWIAGVDDHMVGKTDLEAALRGSYEDEMKLLLAHNPIIFRQAVRNEVDLVLSGHTHGGQVKMRERRGILARRKLTSGLHERKNTQIYITRGIGTVVLPIRYQCPPEISLIELRCE